MSLRNNDGYQTQLESFIMLDMLVKCPKCGKKAIVKAQSDMESKMDELAIKFVCTHCGHNKNLAETPASVISKTPNKVTLGRFYTIGGGTDPYFNLQLWLKTDVEQHTFWAYNKEHLEFLKTYIDAKLRERNGQENSNRSIASRLPKWMTASKSRALLLKKISELEKKC
jgi:DNA-directed RNA polymerase subunit RPC12/RpoP